MLRCGIIAVVDVLGKAPHSLDAQDLQPVIFGGEVGVDLGMPRDLSAVLTQHVVGEKVLRMSARARPQVSRTMTNPLGLSSLSWT